MCENSDKFLVPKAGELEKKLPFSPHFLTPAGMLLPKHQQPPPMYGPRGSTVPPKFIPKYENISSVPSYKQPSGHRNRGPPRRPPPTEQTLPPRNWDLWCESCDKDFISKDQLEGHKSEHKTCGIGGCTFVAHPGIVERHVAQQHETGLFDKLKNLESPEDISKWRNERKKNYPTRANIELKEKVREARKERGETLEASKGRFNQNQKKQKGKKSRGKKQGNKDQQQNRQQNGKGNKSGDQPGGSEVGEEEEVNQGIRRFRGTAGMWDDEDVKHEEKIEEEKEVKVVEEEKVSSNPLLKLIGMYGSDDSDIEEDDEEEKINISGANTEENNVSGDKLKEDPVKETEPVVENPVAEELKTTEIIETPEAISKVETDSKAPKNEDNVKHNHPQKRKHNSDDKEKEQQTKQEVRPKRVLKSGLNYNVLKRSKPNTLLFKLLQGEIRHERNVLLQAVRYVVRSNFFEDKDKEK